MPDKNEFFDKLKRAQDETLRNAYTETVLFVIKEFKELSERGIPVDECAETIIEKYLFLNNEKKQV